MISQVGLEGKKEVSDTEILSDCDTSGGIVCGILDLGYFTPVTLWITDHNCSHHRESVCNLLVVMKSKIMDVNCLFVSCVPLTLGENRTDQIIHQPVITQRGEKQRLNL